MKSLLALLLALSLSGCFAPPNLTGPYRCVSDESCGGEGFVCDDGICCDPEGEPLCPTRVLDGERCASGEAPRTFFRDLDGDGFGNVSEPVLLCGQPVLQPVTEVGGDCNDTPGPGAAIHPDAEELCDALDNNCDGQTDEGYEFNEYFQDSDGDGFGDPNAKALTCVAPEGYVSDKTDCAPQSPDIHPDAVEVCNDRDDNCDGIIDNATEGPPCFEPIRFLSEPGLTFGAKRLTATLNGGAAACWKTEAGTAMTFDKAATPQWTGTGGGTHISWVENAAGWALDKGVRALRLHLTAELTNAATAPWSQFAQPVALVCGNVGFYRLVRSGSRFTTAAATTIDELIPLRGGVATGPMAGSWNATAPVSFSATPVTREEILKDVRSFELQVQPAADADVALKVTFEPSWGVE